MSQSSVIFVDEIELEVRFFAKQIVSLKLNLNHILNLLVPHNPE